MAANVSESPGQPPGKVNDVAHSPPSSQPAASKHQKTITVRGVAPEKHAKDKQSSAICSPSKSKRRFDPLEGHDDSACDSQIEDLCRKKFKPIAPRPTIKKDKHQSVVTATMPLKDIPHSDLGSPFCSATGDRRNGTMMFVSPQVQLIPGMPIMAHPPTANGEIVSSNKSPISITVPVLPHGKYLNIMNPPARVSMTDVAGHFKTVVQLLPNCTSNCVHLASHVSVNDSSRKMKEDNSASKITLPRNENTNCRSSEPANKTSKNKPLSKPKSSKYKYSLLMNGNLYDGNHQITTSYPKPLSHITPPVPLNGGVRLNLPAMLTSSGVLQISIPSVGIANGQVQFCDIPPPVVPHTQPSAATQTVSLSSSVQPVSTVGISNTRTSPGATPNESDSCRHENSVSTSVAERTVTPNKNGLSLDETLRIMLWSPRKTSTQEKQKVNRKQSRQTKNKHKSNASTANSRNKEHSNQPSSTLASGVNSSATSFLSNRCASGVDNTLIQDAQDRPSPTSESELGALPDDLASDHVTAAGIPETNTTTVNSAVNNQRKPDARPPACVVSDDAISTRHLVTGANQSRTNNPDTALRVPNPPASSSVASTAQTPTCNTQAHMPSQARPNLVNEVTTSINVQNSGHVEDCQETGTDSVPQRASSLPNLAIRPQSYSSTTTAPLISFNFPQGTHQLTRHRLQEMTSIPSSASISLCTTLPVTGLCTTVTAPSLQSIQTPQTVSITATSTNIASHCQTVSSTFGLPSRTGFIASTTCSSLCIGRNNSIHQQRNSSSLNSSYQVPGHLRQRTTSHTAVTYSHNAVSLSHRTDQNLSVPLSRPCNSIQPNPLPSHGTYLPGANRPRIIAAPLDSVPSQREDHGAISARRQLHLQDENPGTLHLGINSSISSLGNNQANVLLRQGHQDPLQRQNVAPSVSSPNGPDMFLVSTDRPLQNFFTPPLPVIPHHAGILATAILRSRALERNPWRIPGLGMNTPMSNGALPVSLATSVTRGSVAVTQTASITNGNMNHIHHPDHRIHSRSGPAVPTTLSRVANLSNEAESVPMLTPDRQGRLTASHPGFTDVRSATHSDSTATTSREQNQIVHGHVQSVPLHSNLPENARSAMNEALQRRTRTICIQPPRTEATSLVQPAHTSSSVAAPSIQDNQNLANSQQGQLGNQHEMSSNPQNSSTEPMRDDVLAHQQHFHHIHTMPGARVSTDSMSHLPMPLMPPPPVLYGSSTPVPNLSMTPLHGVPLPGSLSAHSVQGHGMAHQLHAATPPTPHYVQSTGGHNPQGSVNHMFVPTPYGPIHRSLCIPPPSPHPPDLTLMSPRSFGQVHVHDSMLYSPRFSSPIRNLGTGSSLADGMLVSSLQRSYSDERLDTCCSVPYSHSPPIYDNGNHMIPPGFMSPSINRNQAPLQTSLCNSLQRSFSHQTIPERHPGSYIHENVTHLTSHHQVPPVINSSIFASTQSTPTVTGVCNSLGSSVPVTSVSSCNPVQPNQQSNLGTSALVNALSPTLSSAANTPGSTSSTNSNETTGALPSTPTSSSSNGSVRVVTLGSTSDKYLPLELVVTSSPTAVTTSTSVATLPAQLGSEQIVKFGEIILQCSRQILRESGRTVLCCWSCDYHTAEPKKMYRHQRQDEQPMKCQLCSHMGLSRCRLNQHFKEVHMDKDEDPFRTPAVT